MKFLQTLADSKTAGNSDWGHKPYILMILACTLWPLSWIYANENKVNFAEVTMIRGFTLILTNFLVCLLTGSEIHLKGVTFNWLVFRNMIMSFHSVFFSLSQFMLPLPIVHTISCTGVLFIFIVDYLMFDNKVNCLQSMGILIGIVGSIVASNGRLLTKMIDSEYEYHTNFENYITDDPFVISIFSFVFLGVVMMWGFGVVTTKKAKANTFQINFIMGFCLLFSGALIYPFSDSRSTILVLFLTCILTAIPMVVSQWLFIGSLTMTKDTGTLNMMNFWSIFVGYLVSIFRYNEPPNLITTLGIFLVFGGVWITIFKKTKL